MFPLIETALAFALIMLMLSFLVKSLASVVKNHMAYYSDNLEYEVRRLLLGIVSAAQLKRFGELQVPWNSLGEEFLNADNMRMILMKLGFPKDNVTDLEGRIALHRANLKYAFEQRMKNLTLACGLALCFSLNINAFTIWTTLYNDADLRAKYAATGKVDEVLDWYEKKLEEVPAVTPEVGGAVTPQMRDAAIKSLEDERETFKNEVLRFKAEVNFGIGAIWNPPAKSEQIGGVGACLYRAVREFLGSLLTGLFVSIGAPYLHEFVRLVSSISKSRSASVS